MAAEGQNGLAEFGEGDCAEDGGPEQSEYQPGEAPDGRRRRDARGRRRGGNPADAG